MENIPRTQCPGDERDQESLSGQPPRPQGYPSTEGLPFDRYGGAHQLCYPTVSARRRGVRGDHRLAAPDRFRLRADPLAAARGDQRRRRAVGGPGVSRPTGGVGGTGRRHAGHEGRPGHLDEIVQRAEESTGSCRTRLSPSPLEISSPRAGRTRSRAAEFSLDLSRGPVAALDRGRTLEELTAEVGTAEDLGKSQGSRRRAVGGADRQDQS